MKNKKLYKIAAVCFAVCFMACVFYLSVFKNWAFRSSTAKNDLDILGSTQTEESSDSTQAEEETLPSEQNSDAGVVDDTLEYSETNYIDNEAETQDDNVQYKAEEGTEEYWRKYADPDDEIWKPDTYPEETADFDYPEGWLDYFYSKLDELKTMFPDGKYWNSKGCGSMSYLNVTDVPCCHSIFGELYCNTYNGRSSEAYPYVDTSTQCWGFASMLSDFVFGKDTPAVRFLNYDNIHIGDQAVIYNNSHTVFVIDKTDEYVVVAECNADYEACMISWGRKIPREEFTGFYITRWEW